MDIRSTHRIAALGATSVAIAATVLAGRRRSGQCAACRRDRLEYRHEDHGQDGVPEHVEK